MPTIDLHLSLEFSENIKPAAAAAFASAAIEVGYTTVAGMDNEQAADAADAFEDVRVTPLAPATAAVKAPTAKATTKTPEPEVGADGVERVSIDKETLSMLMHAAHYHMEDLQELQEEGMLANDAAHRAHMKSLRESITIACTALGTRPPKPI